MVDTCRYYLGVPFWEKLLFSVIFPKVGSIVRETFDITETSAAESDREIKGVFDRVSHTRSDGRKYL